MATPPQLTPEQRQAALDKATATRKHQAVFRDTVRKGTAGDIGAVIKAAQQDESLSRIKVKSLIESLPGVGKVKAKRVIEEVGIADNRRIGGLGTNQVEALIDLLS